MPAFSPIGLPVRYLRQLAACGRQALTLGTCSSEALTALTIRYYAEDPRARTRHGIGESGLSTWESRALDTWFPRAGRVLVAAAGDGREVRALEQRGLNARGFDPCPVLVTAANAGSERVRDTRLVHAAPSRVPDTLKTAPYDAAVIGWSGYTHIPTSSARVTLLRDIRALLPAGAPLLLSFFVRSGAPRRYGYIQRLAAAVRWVAGIRDRVEPGDTFDGSFDHRFTRTEITGELEAAGFRPVHYTARPYGHAVGVAA